MESATCVTYMSYGFLPIAHTLLSVYLEEKGIYIYIMRYSLNDFFFYFDCH